MVITLTNEGKNAVTRRGADLVDDLITEHWPAEIAIAPGATAKVQPWFKHQVTARQCRLILRLSSGDVTIDLVEP